MAPSSTTKPVSEAVSRETRACTDLKHVFVPVRVRDKEIKSVEVGDAEVDEWISAVKQLWPRCVLVRARTRMTHECICIRNIKVQY